MSASKILVQKFGDGNNKLLYIIINDEDNKSSQANFSEWMDGRTQQKKKEKTSRLVVKIVSREEFKIINLDSCAKEIDNTETYFNNISHFSTVINSTASHFHAENSSSDAFCKGVERRHDSSFGEQYNNEDKAEDVDIPLPNEATFFQTNNEKKLLLQKQNFYVHYDERENYSSNFGQFLSPLEQSLERVKENNAHIMENIHMLNRTLDYTKKKEILDIVCPKTMRSYPCNACGKCFVYETGLRRHYSMRHAIAEMQPRWQVVWTCIQCFQVWPRQDQALIHSSICCNSDNTDCIREIKTSLLLQCEFCEKVFTSIPRLLRHSKIHNTANSYECNACGLAFLSYKTAEQHWLLCPWLKMCYNFSLPKMLLCNACDRKFRNYDQLYNHRYKVGHFITKTHNNQGSTNTLGMLVYQCEMCSQWYTSTSSLRVHKSQYHPQHNDGTHCIDKNNEESYESCYMPANKEHYGNEIEDNHILEH